MVRKRDLGKVLERASGMRLTPRDLPPEAIRSCEDRPLYPVPNPITLVRADVSDGRGRLRSY